MSARNTRAGEGTLPGVHAGPFPYHSSVSMTTREPSGNHSKGTQHGQMEADHRSVLPTRPVGQRWH